MILLTNNISVEGFSNERTFIRRTFVDQKDSHKSELIVLARNYWMEAIQEEKLVPLFESRGQAPFFNVSIARKAVPRPNPTWDAFLRDRENPDYQKGANKECYAFLSVLPVNMEMQEQFLTAAVQLRKRDPSRDVVVLVVTNDVKGSQPVLERYKRLADLRVFVREPLPVPLRKGENPYYKFDYQKILLWNLPYSQVMYLDMDIIIQDDPALAFRICDKQGVCPICASKESGRPGGYFNNGMFIFKPKLEEARGIFRTWFSPFAPKRVIALQDVMNEHYRGNW